MNPTLSDDELSQFARYTKTVIGQLKRGAALANAGHDIENIINAICQARLQLAERFRSQAHDAATTAAPIPRLIINRSYYAIYHYGRALLFWSVGGDDYEKHELMPERLPPDLDGRDLWRNEIVLAKAARHSADYDPYPEADGAFAQRAADVLSTADRFHLAVTKYLKGKGLSL